VPGKEERLKRINAKSTIARRQREMEQREQERREQERRDRKQCESEQLGSKRRDQEQSSPAQHAGAKIETHQPEPKPDSPEGLFQHVLSVSDDGPRLCVIAILSWIASSDGAVDEQERTLLNQFPADFDHQKQLAVEIGQRARPSGLRLACNVVQQMNTQQKNLLLEFSLAMSLADGYLKPSESQILLFLADLTGVGFRGLNELFRGATGKEFPETSDLSSARWWKSRQAPKPESNHGKSAERAKALAVLGLDEDATQNEVREAYRRLASIHHPDRFYSLGPEAVEAANQSFRRIKNAFDYLRAN
jgi:DnaJ like chaperone protein